MSDPNDTPIVTEGHDYLAGSDSPVSGVTHLFASEAVEGYGAADSLCGAIGSYGPFRPAEDAESDDVCKNCERVREQRETTSEDDN